MTCRASASRSYFSNYWIHGIAHDWQWMLGVEAIPAIAFALLLYTVPESPRWLVKQDRFPVFMLKQFFATGSYCYQGFFDFMNFLFNICIADFLMTCRASASRSCFTSQRGLSGTVYNRRANADIEQEIHEIKESLVTIGASGEKLFQHK